MDVRSVHGDPVLARVRGLTMAVIILVVIGSATVLSIATSHSVEARVGGPAPARFDMNVPSPTEDPEPLPSSTAPPPPVPTTPPPTVLGALPAVGVPAPVPARPLRVLVLGDSVARTTAAGMVSLGPQFGMTIDNEGTLGCGVVRGVPFRYFGKEYDALPPGCESWPDAWRAAAVRDQPDVVMVIVGRWELMDRVLGGTWTHIGDPNFDAYIAAELENGIAAATSTGAKVALCTTPYYHRGNRPDGGTWPEDEPWRVDRVNQLIRDAAARHPDKVAIVDFNSRMSVNGQLAPIIDGIKVRYDGVHVTTQAGPWLAPWMLPQLHQIAGF